MQVTSTTSVGKMDGSKAIGTSFEHIGTVENLTVNHGVGVPAELTPETLQSVRKVYLNYIVEHCGSLNPRGISQTNKSVSLPLDEVYISLTAEWERRNEFLNRGITPDDEWSAVINTEENVYDWTDKNNLKVSRRSFPTSEVVREKVELPRAVSQNAKLVVLGDPGAGKTTLTKFLAARFARACLQNAPVVMDNEGSEYGETRLPILVRIAVYADALRKNKSLSLKEFLPDAFGDIPVSRDELNALFQQALKDGNAFLLLDGMDEVAEAGERVEIARKLESFSIGYPPANRILVTSRIVGYAAAPLGGNFQQVTMRDMERPQIERFLTRWCAAVERFHAPDASPAILQQRSEAETNALLHAVDASEGVRRLSGNPLLLTILALIHRNSARLPERRIELYELVSKTLLRDWRLAQAGTEARIVEEYEALELLGPLAYWMHENEPTGLIDDREAYELLCQFYAEARGMKPTHPDVKAAITDFLRRVREHTGLFVERAPGKYGFMHLTFEEYFAAREIVSDLYTAAERIRPHRHKARWEEVIRLAIAFERPKNAAHLIRSAIWHKDGASAGTGYVSSEYEDILCRDLFLAARCLGDCATVEPTLAREVADELVAICINRDGKGRYQSLVERARETLGAIRNSEVGAEALRSLFVLAKNKESYLRRSTISVLGNVGVGSSETLQALLAFTRDKDEDVRSAAISALGRIGVGSSEALQVLLTLIRDENNFVSFFAISALGNVGAGSSEALQAILVLARTNNSNMRYSAVFALGNVGVGSSEALQTLLTLTQDENSNVRSSAARAFGTIGVDSSEALNALLASTQDEEWYVRSSAWESLWALVQEE